jgi:hypothetical protein
MDEKRCVTVTHACFFLPCDQTHSSCLLNILFAVGMDFPLFYYLKLAWNSVVQMRLGYFGLTMVVKRVLMLGKDTQTKENLMKKLGHADLFVRMRVIE